MKVYGILESAQLEQLASNPSNACRGRIYWNTSAGEARIYDGAAWVPIGSGASGSRTIVGSLVAPSQVTAAAGYTPSGSSDELAFVIGDDGLGTPAPIVVAANPQIPQGGVSVGARLTLRGTDDINYVDFVDGSGLNLNGPCRMLSNTVLFLEWDGSVWKETTRSG